MQFRHTVTTSWALISLVILLEYSNFGVWCHAWGRVLVLFAHELFPAIFRKTAVASFSRFGMHIIISEASVVPFASHCVLGSCCFNLYLHNYTRRHTRSLARCHKYRTLSIRWCWFGWCWWLSCSPAFTITYIIAQLYKMRA